MLERWLTTGTPAGAPLEMVSHHTQAITKNELRGKQYVVPARNLKEDIRLASMEAQLTYRSLISIVT